MKDPDGRTTTGEPDRTRVDARVLRTRRSLQQAVISLLADGAGAPPSISAVCQHAGVSRPAFYQSFGTMGALVEAAVGARFEEVVGRAVLAASETPEVIRAVLAELDAQARSTDVDSRALTDEALRAALQTWIAGRLGENHPGATPEVIAFTSAGVATVLVRWLGDGPTRPDVDTITSQIWELVSVVISRSP